MNRELRQELNQDITVTKAACRPGPSGQSESGRCSLDEVSREWDFSDESLSGESLFNSGRQEGINRLIRLLIPTDMNKMGAVRRQAVVCFGLSSACYDNQLENKLKQSNLKRNGGSFGHRLMEVLS